MQKFFEAAKASPGKYLPAYGDWWCVRDVAFFYFVTFLGQTLKVEEFSEKVERARPALTKMLDDSYRRMTIHDMRTHANTIDAWCMRNEEVWFDPKYQYTDLDIAYHFATAHDNPTRAAFIAGVGITKESTLYNASDPSRNVNFAAHAGEDDDPGVG